MMWWHPWRWIRRKRHPPVDTEALVAQELAQRKLCDARVAVRESSNVAAESFEAAVEAALARRRVR